MDEIKIQCLICKKDFFVKPYRKNTAKYCSCECFYKGRKGSIPWNKGLAFETDERVKKYILSGMNTRKYAKGDKHFFWGKHHSKETKEKISKANMGCKAYNWRGGKYLNSYGYVNVWSIKHPFCPLTGYMREHRLILEKYLGRYLDPKEVVHHIDKNTSNNKLKNLMLFKNNKSHLSFERCGTFNPNNIIFDGRFL